MALTDESSGIPATMLVGPANMGGAPYPVYSSMGGGNSNAGGSSYARGGSYENGYSRDDAKEELAMQLQELEQSAPDEQTKRMIGKWMRQLEQG